MSPSNSNLLSNRCGALAFGRQNFPGDFIAAEHFKQLWETLLIEDELAVFQAIGETRLLRRERKIKKSVGGTLYWHCNNFHKGNVAKKAKLSQPKPG